MNKINTYIVTGTHHGSIIEAKSEGDARRAFHACYKGESILSVSISQRLAWSF